METSEQENYSIGLGRVRIQIIITKQTDKFVPSYILKLPKMEMATLAFLEDVREKLITKIPIRLESLRDPEEFEKMKNQIAEEASQMVKKNLASAAQEVIDYSAMFLVNEMLGLGNVEFLLADDNLEEVVINNSKEPIWVYHKKKGWLLTNLVVDDEEQIKNYAAIIGRRIGRQITVLDPLMDAHLLSGDRVNSTLFPISSKGNTITIRMFRRKPWTITDLIQNNTLDYASAAFLWTCFQYEMSIIIAGGTATGKTSLLNTLLPFVPPNQRIISIEETRELNLPQFLHWLPMVTREANPEGKGEIKMLDLMINSLRMRPDRIVVGEVRRQPEAEVLFEALNTGHAVYSTLHANTAEEAFRRLTSPPINLPKDLIRSLPVFAVMFRQRQKNIRRLFEIAEVVSGETIEINPVYNWDARTDKIQQKNDSKRILAELKMFTGMSKEDITKDLAEKTEILKWLVKNNINTINTVGKVITEYYSDKQRLFKNMKDDKGVNIVLGAFFTELES